MAQISRGDLKDALQQMDDFDFEHLIADLWSQRGWETTVSSRSADRGIDVKATRDDDGFSTTAVIQAKRYQADNTVGSPQIQQYASLRQQENADLVVVVTTSDYSQQAEELANDLNVKLVDGEELVTLIEENDDTNLLERYDISNETTTSNAARSTDAGGRFSKTPDWWHYGITPWSAGGNWWKGIAFSSALLLLAPVALIIFPTNSTPAVLVTLVYVLSGISLAVSIGMDATVLRARDIWTPWWWAYIFGGGIFLGPLFLGSLVGIVYLYRRRRVLGYP